MQTTQATAFFSRSTSFSCSMLATAALLRLVPAVLLMLTVCGWTSAHELGAEIHRTGDRIDVVAYFDDDTPAMGAKVTLTDATGKVVITGKTDRRGLFAFTKPNPGVYKVDVDAGDGHKLTRPLTLTITGDPSDPNADAGTTVVSDGPSREEFTRTRWEGLVGGLVAIGLAGLVAFAYVRSGKQQVHQSDGTTNIKTVGSTDSATVGPSTVVTTENSAQAHEVGGGTDPSGDSQPA